ncbi:lipopolysaccharide heptosyltransferase II [Oxalobacteraceae bacterium CAVE-383]|nr:lipopolysaccharide heptosyltransferase II [Oxalobacteraceae bacterium CAVE-383]
MTTPATARILVVAPNWIGDAVMAEPLLRLLKEIHPSRPIDVLSPALLSPVWRAMPHVDTILETRFRSGSLQLKARWQMARQLRRRGYGDVYLLPNTLKSALVPWLARIPRRVGYLGENRYGLLNVIHRDDPVAPRGMVPFYAALAMPPSRLAPAGLPRPRLTVSAEETERAMIDQGLAPHRPLVVFAPGAEFGSAKRWPAAYFGQLAQSVRQENPDAQIVLLGSAKDLPVTMEVARWAPEVVSLAGSTSLAQAIALIARADAVVSNDSGLLHVASAFNRPVVAMYGSTDPDYAPPFSDMAAAICLHLPCSPCRQRECPLQHHKCMRDMLPDQVWQALRPMLPADTVQRAPLTSSTPR